MLLSFMEIRINKFAAVIKFLLITIGLTSSCVDRVSLDIVVDSVDFEDPNFEALIREVLDKPEEEITAEDMLTITKLRGSQREIINISGIEKCVNLTELNLTGNSIGDIAPLSDLRDLKELFLSSNQISDIGPLSRLRLLNDLRLADNQIIDIKPLVDNRGIHSGDYVDLRTNPLRDISIDQYIPKLRARRVNVDWE